MYYIYYTFPTYSAATSNLIKPFWNGRRRFGAAAPTEGACVERPSRWLVDRRRNRRFAELKKFFDRLTPVFPPAGFQCPPEKHRIRSLRESLRGGSTAPTSGSLRSLYSLTQRTGKPYARKLLPSGPTYEAYKLKELAYAELSELGELLHEPPQSPTLVKAPESRLRYPEVNNFSNRLPN